MLVFEQNLIFLRKNANFSEKFKLLGKKKICLFIGKILIRGRK